MRCPDCNKFVGFEHCLELQECSIHKGSNLSVQVLFQLNCQECGTTLKDCDLETQNEFAHECLPEDKRTAGFIPDLESDHFEIDDDGDPESTEPSRKRLGFILDTSVKCNRCGEVFTVTTEEDEDRGSFNECV